MRWTSDFFMTEKTIAEIRPILLFGCAAGHSSVPATDLAAAARRGGQGWPRLRPPQGLALTGPSTAACWHVTGLHPWLALAVRRDYPWWGVGDLVAKRGASAASATRLPYFVLPS